ncbi:MAG: hypothetical protein JWN50_423 [Parcubacteria group bacterium]|nr:hypothetical protein [Parcubacteria group bacterium]
MNDAVDSISYEEALSIRVGGFLRRKGWTLASLSGGVVYADTEETGIGILYKDPDVKPEKYFFGLMTTPPPRQFLGVIWFSNQSRQATEESWVFVLHGRKYADMAKKLADDLASDFRVNIRIVLTSELPVVERFGRAFD